MLSSQMRRQRIHEFLNINRKWMSKRTNKIIISFILIKNPDSRKKKKRTIFTTSCQANRKEMCTDIL